MNKRQRYQERHKHQCADCDALVLKDSKRCKTCDKKRRSVEMSENPVHLRHGLSDSPEHYIWASMIQRCTNPRAKQYQDYGGRGIRVCERWTIFENFFADMGPRPEGTHPSGRAIFTIDRKDNDGDYSPDNCVWATYTQQARNKSSGRMITYQGRTMTLMAWTEELGINYKTAHTRFSRGWPAERVFARDES